MALTLVALTLVAVVGRVRVRRILHAIAARLRLDRDLVLHDFALLGEHRHHRPVARTLAQLRVVGEAIDQRPHVFRHLQSTLGALLRRQSLGGVQLGRRHRVTPTQLLGQSVEGIGLVTLHLREKSLVSDGHHAGAAEAGHVAEDVRRIEPLLVDLQIEFVDQLRGDFVHHLGGEIVVEKMGAIAFEGSAAHFGARLGIEGELDVGAKEEGFDGLVVGPVERFLEKEESGDGIQFLGGPAHEGIVVFAEFLDGHEDEQHGTKDGLPTLVEAFESEFAEEALEGVEQDRLRGIDDVLHAGVTPLGHLCCTKWTRSRQGENAAKSEVSAK